MYDGPWQRQKQLQKKYRMEEVPDIDELVRIIIRINIGKDNPQLRTKQARALFALYYLTGCRASEIVKCPYLRYKRYRKTKTLNDKGERITAYIIDDNGERLIDEGKTPHEFLGLRKSDIKQETVDGKPCLYIRTENRKHADRRTKRQPIPIEFEEEIVVFINDYLKMLEDEDFLFEFGVKRSTQIINEATGFNIHFIRHIRATHLVTKYDFNEQMLIKFMGWTDARPDKNYMELRSTDLFRQFYKNKQ